MIDDFYIEGLITSLAMLITGIVIRLYLKKYDLDNYRKLLGVGAFWLRFLGIVLMILGSLSLIVLAVTYYYQLKYDSFQ